MSVHCLESGCIGKYTPLGPRDFPRASGGVFSDTSLLSSVYEPNTVSVANECHEIHPYSTANIDSVKINTSLMMRECPVSTGHCPGRQSICPLLFLQPLSEGCGTRLTIRNKDQKNSDCKTRWLVFVFMKWAQM